MVTSSIESVDFSFLEKSLTFNVECFYIVFRSAGKLVGKNLLATALVARRLPRLAVVCTKQATLSTNSCLLLFKQL